MTPNNRTDMETNTATSAQAPAFSWEIDYKNDGMLILKNDRTLKLYHKLKYEDQPVLHEVFWAFSPQQFAEGIKKHNLKDKKIYHFGGGGYGTMEGIDEMNAWYEKQVELIRSQCDPQEVYCYEYNNHECCISWDGDKDAFELIQTIWGDEVAGGIKRI